MNFFLIRFYKFQNIKGKTLNYGWQRKDITQYLKLRKMNKKKY